MANAEVRVEFDSPDEVAARMEPVVNAGLVAAAITVADRAFDNIKRRPGALFPGRKIGKGGGAVSKKGETPTTQTGQLRNRIFYTEPENGEAFVGTDLKYGRNLEIGTTKMAARPWLERSMNESGATASVRAIRAARAKFVEVFGSQP